MKSQGGLEKCFNTSQETPTGRGWVLALPVGKSINTWFQALDHGVQLEEAGF